MPKISQLPAQSPETVTALKSVLGVDVLESGQIAGMLGYATKAAMDADTTQDDGTLALVTNDSTTANNGTYRYDLATTAWVKAADRVTELEATVDEIAPDVRAASGYIGRFNNDVPDTQLMSSTDVRLATNWRAATAGGTGTVQTYSVVELDDELFPVSGLYGVEFAMQSDTLSQRIEILDPFFSNIDLSAEGIAEGDVVTFALFSRNLSVDPVAETDKYQQFGFLMGINAATIAFDHHISMGNGWSCHFVQRTISAADLVDSSTTGSINGVRLRSKATATDTFSGILAAPIIFKGSSVGFLRYLLPDSTELSNATRSLVIENQLRGEVVGFVGDSRTAQGLVGSGYKYLANRSYIFWLRALSRQAFDTTTALNFGQSGWRTDQILAALPGYITSMKAARVQVCCLLAGTNDISATNPATSATYTASETVANLSAMCELLTAAGIRVVLLNETPRGDLTAPEKVIHVAIRDGIDAMHSPKDWITVVDSWTPLADTTDPTIAASWATVDNIHPSVRGCYEIGAAVWDAMQTMIPARGVVPTDDFQMIARNGNMLANAFMEGTGTVADYWTAANNAGGTAAAVSSLVTMDGKTWQKAVVSGTPSGSDASPLFLRWTQNIDIYKAEFQSGDVLDAMLEVKVDNPVGIRSIDFYLVGPGNYDGAADIAGATSAYQLGPDSWAGVLRSLPVTLTGEPANLQMRVRIVLANGVAASGDFYWRAAVIRRRNR